MCSTPNKTTDADLARNSAIVAGSTARSCLCSWSPPPATHLAASASTAEVWADGPAADADVPGPDVLRGSFLPAQIGLLNTLQGLVIVFLGGGIPFNAWLFKGYVDGLPRDLEESAYVDGATKWQAFWKVILPLTRPMMAVIFIFVTIGIYNDYILTNI